MTQTLEKKTETRGPDEFAALVPQFESLNIISQTQEYLRQELTTSEF